MDVKQAIANAKRFAADVLGTDDLLLEEVHSRPDFFEITLSFPHRSPRTSPLLSARREYNTFKVNKQSGQVEGMPIREIA